jgi:hypothetical protein
MSYSRRQLYALGEPLGESVTRTKPGGRIYGGGDSSAPTHMTQTSLSYAPEFQPAINQLFQGAAALASQPYETYQYNRIARFDPMQLQAQQAAANMRVSPYIGQSAGLAKQAAMFNPGQFGSEYISQLGNANYNPTQFGIQTVTPERIAAERASTGKFTDRGVASAYMSPYLQNVVDIGKREAQRQADIAATQRGAQAVGAGAFGGSRQAIMEAEAQRNLAQQMGDIQAKGSQAAFEQAAQQYQTDAQRNLAMQQGNIQAQLQAAMANQQTGLTAALANQAKALEAQQLAEQSRQFGAEFGTRGRQAALQADLDTQKMREQSRQFGSDIGLRSAAQLERLGQTHFGQARDIIGMQSQFGAERQAMLQRKLSQDYDDFLRQKQYPYTNYSWLSEIARGMPTTQTQQIYQAPPSLASQALGYTVGAYGLNRLMNQPMANGGLAGLAINNLTRG